MATTKRLALADQLTVEADRVRLRLSNGSELSIPFAEYRFLRGATAKERNDCVIDEGGTVIWWPALVDGISVAGLLEVPEDELYALAEREGRL